MSLQGVSGVHVRALVLSFKFIMGQEVLSELSNQSYLLPSPEALQWVRLKSFGWGLLQGYQYFSLFDTPQIRKGESIGTFTH
jgi:hypothetical protein